MAVIELYILFHKKALRHLKFLILKEKKNFLGKFQQNHVRYSRTKK